MILHSACVIPSAPSVKQGARVPRCLLPLGLFAVLGCGMAEKPPIVLGHLYQANTPAGIEERRGLELALAESTEPSVSGRGIVIRHADTRGQPALPEAQAVREVQVHP